MSRYSREQPHSQKAAETDERFKGRHSDSYGSSTGPQRLGIRNMTPEIMKYFQYDHLVEGSPMREISRHFCELAYVVLKIVPDCSQRDAALDKLLTAKDCAVRASLP